MDMNTNEIPNVICFGEVLWDNLPGGRQPGGAPMNVAYHLNKLGITSNLVSRLGNDENGTSLLEMLKILAIGTGYCQLDQVHKTSTVAVNIGLNDEVSYEIVFPVAWDFIASDPEILSLTSKADAFVFGSLAGRNEISRGTLNELLDVATYRVFDVNLRAPYYGKDYLDTLFKKTDLLKLNAQELTEVTSWYTDPCAQETQAVKLLQDKFGIKEVIVTKGSAGATFYTGEQAYHQPAYPVTVADTVGSGDSFLAAFLSERLKSSSIERSLEFAASLAAFVTTHSGACPAYQRSDIPNYFSSVANLVKSM